ncbi:MAG: hypothetical protein PHT12_01500 [Patescibacteria group bacterium]|nr:hypothetical protein [Patescibacteria group bacterium]
MDKKTTIYIFGNPDLQLDSLPLHLLPDLCAARPDIEFVEKDPNEEWGDLPADLTVIDTVVGISEPRVFDGLDDFLAAPRLSMHDFDAYTNLRLLQKLGHLKSVRVLGLPTEMDENAALEFITRAVSPVTHQ